MKPPRTLGIGLIVLTFALGQMAWALSPQPLTPAEAQKARYIMSHQCAKCHRQPRISKYSEASWRFHLGTMGPKSKLTPAQTDILTRYIMNEVYRNNPMPYP